MNSLILNKLSLINYKNILSSDFELDSNINCFVGNNGVGKTNVLDSIYHLAMSKSYFHSLSSQTINHNAKFMLIEGDFTKGIKHENIICSLKKGQNKTLKRNGKIYKRFSDHIGLIPVVMISPYDRDLIQEGSSNRRKFTDNVISQNNKTYLTQIIKYQKILFQRNALLKFFKKKQTFDIDILKVYDNQLSELSIPIHNTRLDFFKNFVPVFIKRYNSISQNKETVNISYDSQLNYESLNNLLNNSLEKDRIVQYTSCGIHKDDLIFEIDKFPIKKFGSQGQQKTFLIALKLAQFDYLKTESNSSPILLLDDIFDKLDNNRVKQLIQLVNEDEFGQLFISDTDYNRTKKIISEIDSSYKMFKL
ncbi:MAG: DNA replication and repair protein RecF [Flavobacteriaceae bacterium]|jgi:DNA replication and repair protein RecF|nr:DNA replication and repair protein RecF [Flavobacteriaceae bacterium]MBT3754289.1 DNA replication and repair protein RecF [Flavobacteriaceae bacterium]MBT4063365.1 DNA replication and repair protein RecF [Flavobacteriaceae bacterium]MBT4415679.1 DNA replication and repair protein RecF [Flavobacteriaceae bacterium]MBT5012217.1 DNA replication and repair protein RecF [Flavobacteriaceae bacterium]